MPIPPEPFTGFLGAPVARDGEVPAADFAILGVPHTVFYDVPAAGASAEDGPRAVRARAARYARAIGHHDFDLGGPLFDGSAVRLVDCGDVPADPADPESAAARATAAIARLLAAGALPIVLGGDDSVTATAIRAFDGHGPLHVLQIDAHLDFRDEVNGIRHGYSSPMRRASEMPWVRRIVHTGQRGVGSARPSDVADTLAAGNVIVTAREVRERGVERVLAEFPPGARYYVALDCDGVDPSVMPATVAPLPGGLAFYDTADLLTGLARRGRVVGLSVTEHHPALDVNGLTALAITRLVINLLGAVTRARPAP